MGQAKDRPLCLICKKRRRMLNKRYKKKDGTTTEVLKKHCMFCHRKKYNIPNDYRSRFKKDMCEKCKFLPIYKRQLHLDHIDGNRENNSRDNLQTLCANCHEAKTHENRDGGPWKGWPDKKKT